MLPSAGSPSSSNDRHCTSIMVIVLYPRHFFWLRARACMAAPGQVGSGFTCATERVAGAQPRVPEAPLPAVASPGSAPIVGNNAADPTVCWHHRPGLDHRLLL
jgi:hypothetical protein